MAKGADVLVHETMYVPALGTTIRAAIAKGVADDSIDDETWRTPVAKYFKGEIIVGKDLMVV